MAYTVFFLCYNHFMINIFTGKIRINKKGIGFFRGEGVKDFITVMNEDIKTALDFDKVKIEVIGKNKWGELTGKVTEIIKRDKNVWTGVYREIINKKTNIKQMAFVADNDRFYPETKIKNLQEYESKIDSNTKILTELVEWKNINSPAILKITKILGKIGEHETETKAAIYDRGLVMGFSNEAENAAAEIKKNSEKLIANDLLNRKDLRDLNVFTIDPADAKDFDDAIDIQFLENGNYKIGVHIADPTFFIQPNSILDNVAKERATSIYLIDRTIPMLPEVLSNDLCSLNPNEDKMAFSIIFEMDNNANIINEWIGKTIINSKRRFNYIEAQNILDDKHGDYFKELKTLIDIADKLEAKRVKNGSIQFNSTEVKFKLDNNKLPIDIYQKKHVHTMDLIEEFALLSNKSISRFAAADSNLKRNKNPFIFRIHDEPKQEKVSEIISFLNKLGIPADLNKDGKLSASEMNKVLKESKGTPEEGILSLSILKTMQKAIYGTEARGHFGLAFKYYSHFTSPIRRYPDMIAHRLLIKYLNGENVKETENTKILKLANHSSEMELKAVSAERESISFKYAQYYSLRIGEKFFGIITSVKKFGVFVENIKTKASGMINIRNIDNDFLKYDEKTQTIRGQKSGKIYKLGDKIEAKILEVNIENRKIDLTLK